MTVNILKLLFALLVNEDLVSVCICKNNVRLCSVLWTLTNLTYLAACHHSTTGCQGGVQQTMWLL